MPHRCYYYPGNSFSRKPGYITKVETIVRTLHITIIFWDEGTYTLEDDVDANCDGVDTVVLPLHAAFAEHKWVPLQPKRVAEILMPQFHLSGWVLNDARKDYWLHPSAPHFAQIPEIRREYALQFWKQPMSRGVASLRTRHFGFYRSSTTNRVRMLRPGMCFIEEDNSVFIITDVSHRASKDEHHFDESVMQVERAWFRPLDRSMEIRGSDTVCALANEYAKHRLQDVALLDMRTLVCEAWKRVEYAQETLVVDVTQAGKYIPSDNVFFCCGTIDGESNMETACTDIRLDQLIEDWAIEHCGLAQELLDNLSDPDKHYHLAPYTMWEDGMGLNSQDKMG